MNEASNVQNWYSHVQAWEVHFGLGNIQITIAIPNTVNSFIPDSAQTSTENMNKWLAPIFYQYTLPNANKVRNWTHSRIFHRRRMLMGGLCRELNLTGYYLPTGKGFSMTVLSLSHLPCWGTRFQRLLGLGVKKPLCGVRCKHKCTCNAFSACHSLYSFTNLLSW